MSPGVTLALLAALTCAGCAATLPAGVVHQHGYDWVLDDTRPHCTAVTWVHDPYAQSDMLKSPTCRGGEACAPGCTVYSIYSEATARKLVVGGITLYDHERKHVLERLAHPRRQ